jgi:hypothetical protein
MNTFGGYFSVAFSVMQADDAGAVGVGVGVGVADADPVAIGVDNEATGWPPHAVAEIRTATPTATPAARR